ncbi:hypothetical protein [Burkholderia sp. MSMB1826]|uniref:hypothetical protein n=1 Tax=Burkholderia sp. MSMB1826 TaxID=1637875 RepID=UPI000752962C|nr:hypothetical protein [Burkholderia sp. MSMB1826]KVL14707.1 hypothetical protein WS95_22765 [Burkholderia sp. MSMB1826]
MPAEPGTSVHKRARITPTTQYARRRASGPRERPTEAMKKPAMRPARLNDVNHVDDDKEFRRCCAG